eukprot:758004-Hanusia_phi.AAC.1
MYDRGLDAPPYSDGVQTQSESDDAVQHVSSTFSNSKQLETRAAEIHTEKRLRLRASLTSFKANFELSFQGRLRQRVAAPDFPGRASHADIRSHIMAYK